MHWPTWIDALKDRYLADEANVFVLHGAVDGTTFPVGDEQLDCVGILRRFLSRTRPVVGVLRPWPHPARIEFAGILDRTHFENLVKAHEFVTGRTDALQESEPTEALARIWRALDTVGTDQAYLITDAQRIAPGHRRRVDEIPGAPTLLQWPIDPGLRASNNLIALLVEDPRTLREELLERCAVIEVTAPAAPDLSTTPMPLPDFEDLSDTPEPTLVPTDDLPAALDEPLAAEPEPTLVPPDPGLPTDPESLHDGLKRALVRAFLTHDAGHRAALLPVMEATAEVLATHRPDLWGTLTFQLGEDRAPVVTGTGSDRFLPLWRGDITMDAAASMITRELPTDGAPTVHHLDETGVRVLAKRIAKQLDRL